MQLFANVHGRAKHHGHQSNERIPNRADVRLISERLSYILFAAWACDAERGWRHARRAQSFTVRGPGPAPAGRRAETGRARLRRSALGLECDDRSAAGAYRAP